MSRYSPQVLPIAGPTLADALVQGVGAFMTQRDRMRKQTFEDNAEMRAQNADARADAVLGIQKSQESRAADNYGYTSKYVRPLEQAVRRVRAYDDGVDYSEDMQIPAGNEEVPGAEGYSFNKDRTPAAQAAQIRKDNATIAQQNRVADAVLARERMASAERIAGQRAGAQVRTAEIRSAATREAARIRTASGGASGTAAALREAEDKAGRSAMQVSRLLRQYEESGNDPAMKPELDAAREQADFDQEVFDILLRERAPVTLPPRGSNAPPPAPPSPLERAVTPGVGSMPGNDFPQGVKAPAAPAQARTPAPVRVGGRQTRLTREQIMTMRRNALNAGRDSAAVEARTQELLRNNGLR